MIRLVVALSCAALACGPSLETNPSVSTAASSETRTPTPTPTSSTRELTFAVAGDTASPSPRDIPPPDVAIADKCGAGDARLDAAAAEIARRHLAGDRDLARTSEVLRLAGEPHPWPRVWVASGRGFSWPDLAARIDKWRGELPRAMGQRRCGRALVTGGESSVALYVTVDALADLMPLPMRTRTGAWLSVDARVFVPTTSARVVIVGPDNRPRAVPSHLDADGRVRARFAPDRPGRFAVQVLADVGQGPRPVLEALVFADVAPHEDDAKVPGESAAHDDSDTETLARMVHALREELGLRPLRRDPELDALARAHSERMRSLGKVGHDVGDGDPKARIERSGIPARKAGENVAHAESVLHAHRSLFASPSHRDNLVHADFDRLGVAVVRGDDGTVWVTELFAK